MNWSQLVVRRDHHDLLAARHQLLACCILMQDRGQLARGSCRSLAESRRRSRPGWQISPYWDRFCRSCSAQSGNRWSGVSDHSVLGSCNCSGRGSISMSFGKGSPRTSREDGRPFWTSKLRKRPRSELQQSDEIGLPNLQFAVCDQPGDGIHDFADLRLDRCIDTLRNKIGDKVADDGVVESGATIPRSSWSRIRRWGRPLPPVWGKPSRSSGFPDPKSARASVFAPCCHGSRRAEFGSQMIAHGFLIFLPSSWTSPLVGRIRSTCLRNTSCGAMGETQPHPWGSHRYSSRLGGARARIRCDHSYLLPRRRLITVIIGSHRLTRAMHGLTRARCVGWQGNDYRCYQEDYSETMILEGIIYFPKQAVKVTGNGDVGIDTKQFAIIADTIDVEGNGQLMIRIANNYKDAGLPPLAWGAWRRWDCSFRAFHLPVLGLNAAMTSSIILSSSPS